jgi:hypothetical protein
MIYVLVDDEWCWTPAMPAVGEKLVVYRLVDTEGDAGLTIDLIPSPIGHGDFDRGRDAPLTQFPAPDSAAVNAQILSELRLAEAQ